MFGKIVKYKEMLKCHERFYSIWHKNTENYFPISALNTYQEANFDSVVNLQN